MKIFLDNHSEEYAVREIVNAYFPKVKLEIIYKNADKTENDDYVYSSYRLENGIHCFCSHASVGGKKSSHTAKAKIFDKTLIKKSVAHCLDEITDIHLPWGLLTGIRPSKVVREYLAEGGEVPKKYLTEKFGCDISKAELACSVEKTESQYINSRYPDGISLYIGIPFCPTRCLYCSFTSQSIAFSNKLVKPYLEALKYEIQKTSELEYVKNRRIETVYFGGGTPSALSADEIDGIFSVLAESFDLSHVKEITFEAGRPDTIDRDKLSVLKRNYVSRISINPQTMNDKTLEIIGRNHTSEDFAESFKLARSMGFNHINCDIIAGLPGETIEDFVRTLSFFEDNSPESITVHTMSIKHGSFLDMNYNMYSMTASNTVNRMLIEAQEFMKKQNKHPYYMYRQKNMLGNLENVGYCSSGSECIYNIYIMEEVQPIIALGAGGSTKLTDGKRIERVFNVKEVSEYIRRIDEMIGRKKELTENFNLKNSSFDKRQVL